MKFEVFLPLGIPARARRWGGLLALAALAVGAGASPARAGEVEVRGFALDTLPVLGWCTNIVRRQGADSLVQMYRREAPGANAVFLGAGGLLNRRGDGGPWLAREGAPGVDPN